MTKRFQVSNDIASAETLSSNFYTNKEIFESPKSNYTKELIYAALNIKI